MHLLFSQDPTPYSVFNKECRRNPLGSEVELLSNDEPCNSGNKLPLASFQPTVHMVRE